MKKNSYYSIIGIDFPDGKSEGVYYLKILGTFQEIRRTATEIFMDKELLAKLNPKDACDISYHVGQNNVMHTFHNLNGVLCTA